MKKSPAKIMMFEQFLQESYVREEFQKVAITRRKKLKNSFITGPDYSTKDYWTIIVKDDEDDSIKKDLPVLNYDTKTLEKFLKSGSIREKQVYNWIEAKKRVASKAAFYELHKDSPYIIPTVMDPKEVNQLKFPIVAKPDNNHSGLGITVFDTKEEMDKADLSQFTSFGQKIEIKQEYRFFLWRGEILEWCKRIPLDKETEDIGEKDPEDETNFGYTLMKGNPSDEFLKACDYFIEQHADLDFYAIDIAVDEKDKIYVFEMNSEPGALFGVMTLVYERIYQDYYQTQISGDTKKLLKEFRDADIKQNMKQNPNWKVQE